MHPAHVARFVSPEVIDRIAAIVAPDQLRHEDPDAQRHGLGNVIRHRLRVNNHLKVWHDLGTAEHNPTPLRARDGRRIVLVSEFTPSLYGGYAELIRIIPADSCPDCQAVLTMWLPPMFDPTLLINSFGGKHIALDHSERFGGLTVDQIKFRLDPALREANRQMANFGNDTVAAYWFPRTKSWCFVVPLSLDRRREPIAGVLRPRKDGYHLVTALPRRTAFWNVASLGLTPPAWLDGPDEAARDAA